MNARLAPCSLLRFAGEGWGGGLRGGTAHRIASRAPLPTSPRTRGEASMRRIC